MWGGGSGGGGGGLRAQSHLTALIITTNWTRDTFAYMAEIFFAHQIHEEMMRRGRKEVCGLKGTSYSHNKRSHPPTS